MDRPCAFQPGKGSIPKGPDGKVELDDVDFTETYAVSYRCRTIQVDLF
jgi:hypothetical protein